MKFLGSTLYIVDIEGFYQLKGPVVIYIEFIFIYFYFLCNFRGLTTCSA